MVGQIYISMTGDDNELWDRCLAEKLVAIGFDKPYFDAWYADDYDQYLDLMRAAEPKKSGSAVKAKATRWFRRATLISKSEDDIWLHRDGKDLYWATTTSDQPILEPFEDKVMIAKPVDNWLKRDAKTVALSWKSIHPKGQDYLVTQQAVFRVADEDMRSYLLALVGGEPLGPWHDRKEWKERLGNGKTVGKHMPQAQFAIERMLQAIKETVKNSNGQIIQKALKNKKLLCSDDEMRAHLAKLMEEQQGRCNITGLAMHIDGQDELEHDLLASADRIDSDGHYEIGNMQLVCRFVNFWKSAQENEKFVDLLERIIQHRIAASQQ
ncbi:hypothetical protein ACVDG8_024145 [Mesorhizobium sp. ORM8.1]